MPARGTEARGRGTYTTPSGRYRGPSAPFAASRTANEEPSPGGGTVSAVAVVGMEEAREVLGRGRVPCEELGEPGGRLPSTTLRVPPEEHGEHGDLVLLDQVRDMALRQIRRNPRVEVRRCVAVAVVAVATPDCSSAYGRSRDW